MSALFLFVCWGGAGVGPGRGVSYCFGINSIVDKGEHVITDLALFSGGMMIFKKTHKNETRSPLFVCACS